MLFRALLAVGLGAALTLAQVPAPGSCPTFVAKEDFEVPPYLGTWYEIARFATPDQDGQSCNYAEYSDNGDGTVGVHNAGLNADGTFNEIYGYVETSDVPGELVLHLEGVPVPGDYNVLATDYVTYTAVYSCLNLTPLLHGEQAWILAREPTLSDEALAEALSAFTRWGIDTDKFLYTSQENCPY